MVCVCALPPIPDVYIGALHTKTREEQSWSSTALLPQRTKLMTSSPLRIGDVILGKPGSCPARWHCLKKHFAGLVLGATPSGTHLCIQGLCGCTKPWRWYPQPLRVSIVRVRRSMQLLQGQDAAGWLVTHQVAFIRLGPFVVVSDAPTRAASSKRPRLSLRPDTDSDSDSGSDSDTLLALPNTSSRVPHPVVAQTQRLPLTPMTILDQQSPACRTPRLLRQVFLDAPGLAPLVLAVAERGGRVSVTFDVCVRAWRLHTGDCSPGLWGALVALSPSPETKRISGSPQGPATLSVGQQLLAALGASCDDAKSTPPSPSASQTIIHTLPGRIAGGDGETGHAAVGSVSWHTVDASPLTQPRKLRVASLVDQGVAGTAYGAARLWISHYNRQYCLSVSQSPPGQGRVLRVFSSSALTHLKWVRYLTDLCTPGIAWVCTYHPASDDDDVPATVVRNHRRCLVYTGRPETAPTQTATPAIMLDDFGATTSPRSLRAALAAIPKGGCDFSVVSSSSASWEDGGVSMRRLADIGHSQVSAILWWRRHGRCDLPIQVPAWQKTSAARPRQVITMPTATMAVAFAEVTRRVATWALDSESAASALLLGPAMLLTTRHCRRSLLSAMSGGCTSRLPNDAKAWYPLLRTSPEGHDPSCAWSDIVRTETKYPRHIRHATVVAAWGSRRNMILAYALLPMSRLPPEDMMGDRECCSLCLSPFVLPVTTPCKHQFCLRCVRRWILHEHVRHRPAVCPLRDGQELSLYDLTRSFPVRQPETRDHQANLYPSLRRIDDCRCRHLASLDQTPLQTLASGDFDRQWLAETLRQVNRWPKRRMVCTRACSWTVLVTATAHTQKQLDQATASSSASHDDDDDRARRVVAWTPKTKLPSCLGALADDSKEPGKSLVWVVALADEDACLAQVAFGSLHPRPVHSTSLSLVWVRWGVSPRNNSRASRLLAPMPYPAAVAHGSMSVA